MKGLPNTTTTRKHKTHAPNADTAAIATVAAVAGEYHVLDWIHYSFDDASGAVETLIVEIDSATVWQVDISNAAYPPGTIYFPGGLYNTTVNQELKVTLSASAGGKKGKVNIGYR